MKQKNAVAEINPVRKLMMLLLSLALAILGVLDRSFCTCDKTSKWPLPGETVTKRKASYDVAKGGSQIVGAHARRRV